MSLFQTGKPPSVGLVIPCGLAIVSLFVTTDRAMAALVSPDGNIPIPAGFGPGDRFHLAFVTSTTTDANSNEIAYYNDSVQFAADDAGIGESEGVSWYAIASSLDAQSQLRDARDNALVTAPVYTTKNYLSGTVDLQEVASGFDDLWDGELTNPIAFDEYGIDLVEMDVWTGTNRLGFAVADQFLGTTTSTTMPRFDQGRSGSKPRAWCGGSSFFGTEGTGPDPLGGEWLRALLPTLNVQLALYGLSEELQVVPEPTTFTLVGLGVVWLLTGRKRRELRQLRVGQVSGRDATRVHCGHTS